MQDNTILYGFPPSTTSFKIKRKIFNYLKHSLTKSNEDVADT